MQTSSNRQTDDFDLPASQTQTEPTFLDSTHTKTTLLHNYPEDLNTVLLPTTILHNFMSTYSSSSSFTMSRPQVHNEAVHAANACKAFNDHATTCVPCSNPFLSYETGQSLCSIGYALSGELRAAFKLQEEKLKRAWPEAYHTMDVSLPLAGGVKGPSMGIINVMNSRRTRRLLDAQHPAPYMEIARNASHRRNPSDVSSGSDPSKTYYNYGYTYSSSYPGAYGRDPRNGPGSGSSPGGSPAQQYRDSYTSGGSGSRGERRQVRFK